MKIPDVKINLQAVACSNKVSSDLIETISCSSLSSSVAAFQTLPFKDPDQNTCMQLTSGPVFHNIPAFTKSLDIFSESWNAQTETQLLQYIHTCKTAGTLSIRVYNRSRRLE